MSKKNQIPLEAVQELADKSVELARQGDEAPKSNTTSIQINLDIVRKAKPVQPIDNDRIEINLNIRKDLDNNLLISDSIYFDIFINLKKKEIITYPKSDSMDTDVSYQAQKQFFDWFR